jgi:hypothetical protein
MHLGNALAFHTFADQATVDSNEVTETERDDDAEETAQVAEGFIFR